MASWALRERLMSGGTAVASFGGGAYLCQMIGLEQHVVLILRHAHYYVFAFRHPNAEKLCLREGAPLLLHRCRSQGNEGTDLEHSLEILGGLKPGSSKKVSAYESNFHWAIRARRFQLHRRGIRHVSLCRRQPSTQLDLVRSAPARGPTVTTMPNQGKGQWKKRPNQQDGASGSAANKKRKYFAAGNTAGLPLGSRGFLISCIGGKEQQAAFEASRLLQEVRWDRIIACLHC